MSSMPGATLFITSGAVPVPRQVIQEILNDSCCPVHLRLLLGRAVRNAVENPGIMDCHQDKGITDCPRQKDSIIDSRFGLTVDDERLGPLSVLDPCCRAAVIAHLPLAEVLSFRTGSSEALQLAMMKPSNEISSRPLPHERDRIRVRLLMQQISELTKGTDDATVFQTKMRSYADEAQARKIVSIEQQLEDHRARVETEFDNLETRFETKLESIRSDLMVIKDENIELRAEIDRVFRIQKELQKEKGKIHTKKAKGKVPAPAPMKRRLARDEKKRVAAKDKGKRGAPPAKGKKVIKTAMKAGKKK